MANEIVKKYNALKVNQWRDQWEDIEWDPSVFRRKPHPNFYILSMSAKDLIKLSNVHQRSTSENESRSDDLGIQRTHNEKRSKKIQEFIKYGYPYCDFKESIRKNEESSKMKKPGWLPTGIVINIMHSPKRPNDPIYKVDENDRIEINDLNNDLAELVLPNSYSNNSENWEPIFGHPIEIIDGQHRLFAFKDNNFLEGEDFNFPVIAFLDLDISWQAYLFWSINVSPEKINPSLAYDMYPLLRTEDWLQENPLTHKIYREARAQEIVEYLWSFPKSPWYKKINMLGERGNPFLKQTTWVRAISNNFIKQTGLFYSFNTSSILPWTRAQQAAFLIHLGNTLKSKIEHNIQENPNYWANRLTVNGSFDGTNIIDLAWSGDSTLLNMDSGIQALCAVINEYFCTLDKFSFLASWKQDEEFDENDENIKNALQNLINLDTKHQNKNLNEHIEYICEKIALFDWRSTKAPNLTEAESDRKYSYRGSGGYPRLRDDVLMVLNG